MELINPFAGFEAISQHKKRSLERRGEDIHVALSTWTRTTNMSAQMCVKNVSPFVHSLDLTKKKFVIKKPSNLPGNGSEPARNTEKDIAAPIFDSQ